jgi:hypothetical protein
VETGQEHTRLRTPVPPGSASWNATRSRTAVVRPDPAARSPRAGRSTVLGRLTAGGSDGNERLTVWTGVVLVVLLAVIGVTLLHLRTTLLSVHLFVGLLLLGPVLVKLGSTGYRFVRYYTHNPRYRRRGPPPAYLRLIAPMVVLTTVIVFASGVALLLAGPSSRWPIFDRSLLPIHKVSFILWLTFTGVHVLGHLPEVQRTFSGERELRGAVLAEVQARSAGHPLAPGYESDLHDPRAGRAGRALTLGVGLALGLVLALALIPQFGPWLSYHRAFFGH